MSKLKQLLTASILVTSFASAQNAIADNAAQPFSSSSPRSTYSEEQRAQLKQISDDYERASTACTEQWKNDEFACSFTLTDRAKKQCDMSAISNKLACGTIVATNLWNAITLTLEGTNPKAQSPIHYSAPKLDTINGK